MQSAINDKIICLLCPRSCSLDKDEIGNCNARQRQGQDIVLLTKNKVCAIQIDPMEKKPLYNFYPSGKILSIGMAGCNLHCLNCQNSSISQNSAYHVPHRMLNPQGIVSLLKDQKLKHVAYTYTEPLVHYEYVYASAQKVREYGGTNVLVTAGYINPKPLEKLIECIDAVNLDIKFMHDSIYKKNCDVALKPILKTAEILYKNNIHLEVTHLIIPTLNDKEEDITAFVTFIKENLGKEIPVHFSAFSPQYKRMEIMPTPRETLDKACEIAKSFNLEYIYKGNMGGQSNTYCPSCNELLIERNRYQVSSINLYKNSCPKCKSRIYGVYNDQ